MSMQNKCCTHSKNNYFKNKWIKSIFSPDSCVSTALETFSLPSSWPKAIFLVG